MSKHTTTAPEQVPDPRARATLDALVRSKGLGRFAYFFVTGEGTFFPNGIEEASGSVIDDQGRVFDFWTAWDAQRGEVAFETWEQVEPSPRWLESAEYRRARERVGLRVQEND